LDLRPRLFDLQEGRVLLEGRPGYVHQSGRKGGRPGHSFENIQAVLEEAVPPPGWAGFVGATAFDVFAGYIMLDAWIANTDRHPHNWAVLRHATEAEPLRLAREYWIRKLTQVRAEDVRQIVGQVSGMSDPARTFALSVLKVNRRRILDAYA
jgi:hypothetical protein